MTLFKQQFPIEFQDREKRFKVYFVDQAHFLRNDCEHFIQQRFQAIYHANIHQFLPYFLAIFDQNNSCQAVVGLRFATEPALFLEQYLDQPIQNIISEKTGKSFARLQMVEVGNLSGIHHGSSRLIIIFLTWLLAHNHYQWVAFTGHHHLINSFKKLGLSPLALQDADPARLEQGQQDWGNYYSFQPHVFAADVKQCALNLNQLGVFPLLGLAAFEENIDDVA